MRSFQFKLEFRHFPQVEIRFVIDSKTRISCKEKVQSWAEKNWCGINLLNITLSSPRPLATFWIDLKTSKFFTFSWKKYFLSEIKGNEYRFHLKSKNITLKFCNRRSLGIKKQLSSPRCTEHLCKFPADNFKFPARSEDHERRQHFFRDASSGKEILQAEPASQRS